MVASDTKSNVARDVGSGMRLLRTSALYRLPKMSRSRGFIVPSSFRSPSWIVTLSERSQFWLRVCSVMSRAGVSFVDEVPRMS